MKRTLLVFAAALSIMGCKKTTEVSDASSATQSADKNASSVSNVTYSPTNPILKNANTDFEVGAAINEGHFDVSAYTTLAKTQYNSLTAENEMKFHYIQATKGVFTCGTDIVNFAKANGINRVHGHAIMWYKNAPQWLWDAGDAYAYGSETRKQVYRSLLYNHIYNVFKFYYAYKDTQGKPLVKSWDVVNEAFDDDGTYRSTTEGSTGNVWAKELGNYEAARLAFQYAREVAIGLGDTNLKLFYNDYGHEYSKLKTDAIYTLATTLKNATKVTKTYNGVTYTQPIIDGVGLQMHTSQNATMAETGTGKSIYYAISRMKATGLLVHISELDVMISGSSDGVSATDLTKQNAVYKYVPQIYRTIVPSSQRWGVTLWNIGDSDSWRTGETGGSNSAATLYAKTTYYKKATYENFYRGLNE